MIESEKRAHRVCFTGHRPEKLTRSEKALRKDLEKEIRQAIADGLKVLKWVGNKNGKHNIIPYWRQPTS